MSLSQFSLSGKVSLVTGAGRGIGKAIALTLAAAGADVITVARTQAEIEETSREVKALGRRSMALKTDVSREAEVDDMAQQALQEFGAIDIIVNNAGTPFFQPLVPLPDYNPPGINDLPAFHAVTKEATWDLTIATNLSGVFHVLRALGPHLLERKRGRVINVSSVTPIRLNRFNSAYDAAKGGLIALTRSIAKEWAPYGVTVNSIAPGQFHTAASAPLHDRPSDRDRMLKRIPMRRVGDTSEVGPLAVYLACDAASFITGQVILIDGGESL